MRFKPEGLLAMVLMLAGCGTSPPVPETTYHQLPMPAVSADTPAPIVERINVLPFQADDLRHDRAFVYSLAAPHLTLQQSHYHYWVDPPPRLLQQHLADWLTARAMARFVTTEPYADAAADLWVRGRIVRLEREMDETGERVRLALELRAGQAGAEELLAQRLIDVSEPLPEGATVEAVVAAFAEALERVWSDFGEALRGTVARREGLR